MSSLQILRFILQESEAKKFLMALDGLAAYLETVRNLVISSIEADQLEEEIPKSVGKKILDLIPSDKCLHSKTI